MAKKVKKPISKPKKKGSSKKKKSGNIFTKLIVIIFVIILAFFLIFSVFRPSGKTAKVEKPTSQLVEKQEKKDVKPTEKQKAEEDKMDKKDKKDKMDKEERKSAETKAIEQSIKGTWQSTTGGAFLSMDGKEYRLDFMGVDSDLPIIGTYSVDGDLITFINKKDPCKDVKGLYEVKFNKNEIAFKCKSDDCTKRKATLPTEWEWLDTEE